MEEKSFKNVIVAAGVLILAFIVFGLLWFFFLSSEGLPVGLGWYLFSFASGLTMIVLPCTLPLAFVIVPLSMGKGAGKGFGIALSFGLGVALTLSLYGVLAAAVGQVALETIGAPLETVKNWLYFVAGIFAYLFALSEIGLLNFRMPTYTGAAPGFIQKKGDYLKALLLGLFLGNIGVGCPHPATPVILTRIAASGDIFYGWLLFFIHAVGRILPLLLLAVLGILGVNALTWLIQRKDKIERATGWGMVYVAAFILVLGFFTHDWWVNSGQHTLLEEITGEEKFLGTIAQKLGVEAPHTHEPEEGPALFGFPLWLGNWVLVFLWVLPLWWQYLKKLRIKNQILKLKKAEELAEDERFEIRSLPMRFWFNFVFTLLLALTFIWVLPDRFLNHAARGHMEEGMPMMEMEHMEDHGKVIYHEEGEVKDGLVVNMNANPVPFRANSEIRFDFFVNEKPEGKAVFDLEVSNEKLMHIVGVRDDMNEFFHIHPLETDVPGVFSVNYTFRKPGVYKIWSEVKRNGIMHTFGHPEILISGEGEAYKKDVYFGKNAITGSYQVFLSLKEPVVKNKEIGLIFDVHDLFGREVELEDYLGEKMHLSVIKDDWSEFIHTHPERENGHVSYILKKAFAHGNEAEDEEVARGADEKVNFHVVFPEAGLYKIFAQFRPQGIDLPPDEALLASFWINVLEEPPLSFSKSALVLISLILIGILSYGVHRFLKVEKT